MREINPRARSLLVDFMRDSITALSVAGFGVEAVLTSEDGGGYVDLIGETILARLTMWPSLECDFELSHLKDGRPTAFQHFDGATPTTLRNCLKIALTEETGMTEPVRQLDNRMTIQKTLIYHILQTIDDPAQQRTFNEPAGDMPKRYELNAGSFLVSLPPSPLPRKLRGKRKVETQGEVLKGNK